MPPDPIDIHSLARDSGTTIDEYPMERSDGLVTRLYGRPRIVVRSTACIRRRRYAIAHELGHISDGTTHARYCLLSERHADSHARAILLPEGRLREAVEEWHTEYSVLASIFGVPEEVVERRCQEVFQ